jgi:hypothetical protein
VLWLNGKDLRRLPLIKRKRRLELLIPTNNSTLSRVLAVEEHGRELYEAAQRLDLEGIVAKRKADPYSPQTVWYKIKNPAYTQTEGRGDLFDRRHRSRRSTHSRFGRMRAGSKPSRRPARRVFSASKSLTAPHAVSVPV